MQDMVNAAPKLMDYLGEESLAHFGVRKILDHNNIPYVINTRLVRGLGLLQPHRVRVGDGQAGLAGHRLRRRPLRPADRFVRRQADAGRRFRHGHRAPAGADEGSRRAGNA
jgi:hypothetical protein